jgi:hypothetical protein
MRRMVEQRDQETSALHDMPSRRQKKFLGIRKFNNMHVRDNRAAQLEDAQKGCPARPQRAKIRGVPSGYVEGLSDARTLLAGFFSIRLELVERLILKNFKRFCCV